MTHTEQTLRAILRYTGHAESHSALSTVHMLAGEALEVYSKERAELSSVIASLEREVELFEEKLAKIEKEHNARQDTITGGR